MEDDPRSPQEPKARASRLSLGQRIAPIVSTLLLVLVVLAVAQSWQALHSNLYLEQGLMHLAALSVSQQIASATIRVLWSAAALLVLAFLVSIGIRYTSRRSKLGAGLRALTRGIDAVLRRLPGRVSLLALSATCALLVGASYLYARSASRPPPPTGPNILLIVMDTVRKSNLSTYGHRRRTTPKIDQFAQDAIVFENAFAIGPWTIPNHASMFTGLYPSEHGATQESKYLPATALTLAEVLSEYGYDTAGFVNNVNVAAAKGFAQGFRHYRDLFRAAVRGRYELVGGVPDGDAGAFATRRAALDWLDEGWDRARPFFVFINYIEAHSPYRPAQRFAQEYLQSNEDLSPRVSEYDYVDFLAGGYSMSEAEFELSEALYDAEIRYLDEQIDALLRQLQTRELFDDTLVILTSDHGESFGEHQLVGHQFGLYDTVLRVPLIVRAPKSYPLSRRARRSDRWVDLPDLFATVLEVAGIQKIASALQSDGRPSEAIASRNILDNGGRETALAEYYRPLKCLRKLSERYPDFDHSRYDRRLRALREGAFKLIWSSDGRHELYNTDDDPDELQDLSMEYAAKRSTLVQRIEDWVDVTHSSRGDSPQQSEPELDDEMRAELKALGYVE